jgi:hypothetical protein
MRPPTKLQMLANFWAPKNVTTLYHPRTLQFISVRLFSVPQFEKKFKGLHFADVSETQESVTDELKNVLKEEFSAAFQKMYDPIKACIYENGDYFE